MQNQKNYLLLTLGHNSSAIFFNPVTNYVIGYEQERLSGIKCDSQFPYDAINEIRRHVSSDDLHNSKIYISHWFDCIEDGQFLFPNKYYNEFDKQFLTETASDDITYCNNAFTHHDAHAYSALSFFNYHLQKEGKADKLNGDLHTLVFDGFGNNQEVISLYKLDKETCQQKLVYRVKNYYASLGLLYQYATSYVGMKENQDEYKFLGYEAHIDRVFSKDEISLIKAIAYKFCSSQYIDRIFDSKNDAETIFSNDYVIDIKRLNYVKNAVWNYLDYAVQQLKVSEDLFKMRVAVGYIVQYVVETIAKEFIKRYDIHNLLVAGGTFYNVKLNNCCLQTIDGLFSVVPVAGDQGAAIGFVEKDGIQFNWEKLTIGPRRFYNVKKLLGNRKTAKYVEVHNQEELQAVADEIAQLISDNEIVNVVQNNIEYGPRALCSTTSMMLPTKENADENNFFNGRTSVMPFAPMIRAENKEFFFDKDELDRVIGSDNFMICTHDYKTRYSKMYAGCMHKKTLVDNVYTGRPQFISDKDSLEWNILKNVEDICQIKCLINTSFNPHSWPILFDIMDIIHGFDFQYNNAKENKKPYLYIVNKMF